MSFFFQGYNPQTDPDAVAWWDFKDRNTLSLGTVGVGPEINSIIDKVQGILLTPQDAGDIPQLINDGASFNTLNGLVNNSIGGFNTSHNYLHAFAVYRLSASASAGATTPTRIMSVVNGTEGDNNSNDGMAWTVVGTTGQIKLYTNGNSLDSSANYKDVLVLGEVILDASGTDTRSLVVDGTSVGSGGTALNTPMVPTRVGLGCRVGASQGDRVFEGVVHEVIWYSSIQTGEKLEKIRRHFREKWAIAKPLYGISYFSAPPAAFLTGAGLYSDASGTVPVADGDPIRYVASPELIDPVVGSQFTWDADGIAGQGAISIIGPPPSEAFKLPAVSDNPDGFTAFFTLRQLAQRDGPVLNFLASGTAAIAYIEMDGANFRLKSNGHFSDTLVLESIATGKLFCWVLDKAGGQMYLYVNAQTSPIVTGSLFPTFPAELITAFSLTSGAEAVISYVEIVTGPVGAVQRLQIANRINSDHGGLLF